MRRRLSSGGLLVDDGDILKELIDDIDTDHSSTEGDKIDEKASKLKRIDSIKYDKDFKLDIEHSPPCAVKHRQRNNSISVVKDVFGRRGCLVLLVIVIIFLVVLALIIHKILSSVRDHGDIKIDPQVHI